MKITNVTYHRNGISGRGCWAANVTREGERLTVVRTTEHGGCYVTSRDNDATHCFRGDHFAEEMDKAIEAYKLANWPIN